MPEFVPKVPLTLILLGAALWTFGIACWQPAWLNQNRRARLMTTAFEGFMCASIWGAALVLGEKISTGTAVVNGFLAGLAWIMTAYYSRSRYQNTLQRTTKYEGG